MPGFSDDGLVQYAYNTHLRWVETQVFNRMGGRSADQYQRMAREDVRRDLRKYGYIDPLEPRVAGYQISSTTMVENLRGEIANRSSKAEGVIQVTNTATGEGAASITVTTGSLVQDLDPYGDDDRNVGLDSARGAYRWEVTEAATIAPGESAEVSVRATVAGAPHNVCAGSGINGEIGKMYAVDAPAWSNTASIEWGEVTLAGADHQLARLVTYRALAYIFADQVLVKDDPSDYKRTLYEARYKDELARLTASGIEITQDGNATTSAAEDRLRYGSMTLFRS